MAKKQLKTFVLNDESVVNSYGFRVRNSGLDYTRFDQNPVMLDSHQNRTDKVLGNWLNRQIEGTKVLMDANFDTDDDEAKKIEGKVERGFVKGASFGLGISFEEHSWERQPDGSWDLLKAEVMEASVCGVPSNSGSLALYNINTGELIAEDQFKLSLQNLSANDLLKLNTPTMEKIILSTAALSVLVGLNVPTDNLSGSEISNALVKLNAELETSKTKVTDLQGKLDAQLKLQAEALIDQAIVDEKLTAGEREEYLASATANFALTSKLIAKLPGKVSLSGKVNNATAGEPEFKTLADFQKAPVAKQLAFKSEHPDEYKELFNNKK